MKSIAAKLVLITVIVAVAIQFIPVDRSNPPVEEEIVVAPQLQAILKRACYDCHSHETIWPWYSQVAPASWLLAWDVHEGREELNFSTWNRYSPKKRNKFIKEIWGRNRRRRNAPLVLSCHSTPKRACPIKIARCCGNGPRAYPFPMNTRMTTKRSA